MPEAWKTANRRAFVTSLGGFNVQFLFPIPPGLLLDNHYFVAAAYMTHWYETVGAFVFDGSKTS